MGSGDQTQVFKLLFANSYLSSSWIASWLEAELLQGRQQSSNRQGGQKRAECSEAAECRVWPQRGKSTSKASGREGRAGEQEVGVFPALSVVSS